MTNRYKTSLLAIFLVITALLFASCGEGTTGRLSTDEVKTIEDYLLSSYFMLRGDAELADSRAAWDYTKEVLLPATDGATTTSKSNNYPEKGQNTNVTITGKDVGNNIYTVVNVTTYPRQDAIVSTTESYYIKDNGDGYLNNHDSICEADGTINTNYRIAFETEYADGSIRYEKVAANTLDGSNLQYAPFDINGDLVFPSGTTYTPPADTDANYSSMVNYVQEYGDPLNFYSDYTIIVGTRYYTEHGDLTKPTKTSLAYERTFTREAAVQNLDTKISALTDYLFSGADFVIKASETVIRYEIRPNGKKTVKTKTQLLDEITGGSIVTFTANYETDDSGTVISSGAPVAVY